MATPATFPGINILQNITGRMAVSDRRSHFTCIIKLIYKHSEYLSAPACDGFNVSYLSACPEKLALDANLKEVKAVD